jgi:hypothetical protein
MNLEYVSVENSKYHRKYCPPGLEKSTASLTYPSPLRQAEADKPMVANPEIDRVLQRLYDKGLCGEAHVTQYLLYSIGEIAVAIRSEAMAAQLSFSLPSLPPSAETIWRALPERTSVRSLIASRSASVSRSGPSARSRSRGRSFVGQLLIRSALTLRALSLI